MGFLDTVEGLAEQHGQGGETNNTAAVMPALMQTLDEHPGGLAGVVQHLQSNGMAEPVQQWSTGQQQTATPQQVQQGFAGSGFIEKVAEHAGVSPQVAQMAIATALPMLLAHFTQGGQQAAPSTVGGGGFSGMASMLMGKLL